MSWAPPRRFWTAATVLPGPEGFAVSLDARPLRTPGGTPLRAPTAALAAEISAEWDALDAEVDPRRLPLTRLANSAIERVAPQHAAVTAAVAEYGATDLICYRAAGPDGLVARQAAGWDPWLAWAEREFGAPLVTATGVMPCRQPPFALAALRAVVAGEEAFGLMALHDLVALSGSLVLGLAVRRAALEPAAAWELSRIDETWPAEPWGLDSEAEAAAASGRAAFFDAARFSALLS